MTQKVTMGAIIDKPIEVSKHTFNFVVLKRVFTLIRFDVNVLICSFV